MKEIIGISKLKAGRVIYDKAKEQTNNAKTFRESSLTKVNR